MKARCLAAAILAAVVVGCAPPAEKGPRPVALATVNGVPVTVSMFRDKLRYLKLGFSNVSSPASGTADAKMDLLSQLIEEEMYMQEARRLKISVTGPEVDARLKSTMSDYSGVFEKSLRDEGLTPGGYREELIRSLTAEKLIESQVYRNVRVSADEARRYYDSNRASFRRPERVRARQIVVSSRKEAQDILAQLKKGADFSWLAKSRSLSPDGIRGGDLGYFAKDEMPREFSRTVFRMKPGDVSGIVKTPYGYHIFKVEGVMKAKDPTFEEAMPEVVKRLAAERGEGQFGEWLKGLKARTAITVNYDLLRTL